MRYALLSAVALLLLCPAVSWSVAFTWTDDAGIVHFSDVPPENGAAAMLRFDEPCRLQQDVQANDRLRAVVILGTLLGGTDESNVRLARKRLSEQYHALALPLHDLEEFCKGGDQVACACLAGMVDRPKPWRSW